MVAAMSGHQDDSKWSSSTKQRKTGRKTFRNAEIEVVNDDRWNKPIDGIPVLECDYSAGSHILFRAIQSKSWYDAIILIKKEIGGSPLKLSKSIPNFMPQNKLLAVTWVYRNNRDGTTKWRITPLHAAIIFGAPIMVVQGLLDLYPQASKLKDDKGNLPMHLAFKNGSDFEMIALLIKVYQEGLQIKNGRGLLPVECSVQYRKNAGRILAFVKEIVAKTDSAESPDLEKTTELQATSHQEEQAQGILLENIGKSSSEEVPQFQTYPHKKKGFLLEDIRQPESEEVPQFQTYPHKKEDFLLEDIRQPESEDVSQTHTDLQGRLDCLLEDVRESMSEEPTYLSISYASTASTLEIQNDVSSTLSIFESSYESNEGILTEVPSEELFKIGDIDFPCPEIDKSESAEGVDKAFPGNEEETSESADGVDTAFPGNEEETCVSSEEDANSNTTGIMYRKTSVRRKGKKVTFADEKIKKILDKGADNSLSQERAFHINKHEIHTGERHESKNEAESPPLMDITWPVLEELTIDCNVMPKRGSMGNPEIIGVDERGSSEPSESTNPSIKAEINAPVAKRGQLTVMKKRRKSAVRLVGRARRVVSDNFVLRQLTDKYNNQKSFSSRQIDNRGETGNQSHTSKRGLESNSELGSEENPGIPAEREVAHKIHKELPVVRKNNFDKIRSRLGQLRLAFSIKKRKDMKMEDVDTIDSADTINNGEILHSTISELATSNHVMNNKKESSTQPKFTFETEAFSAHFEECPEDTKSPKGNALVTTQEIGRSNSSDSSEAQVESVFDAFDELSLSNGELATSNHTVNGNLSLECGKHAFDDNKLNVDVTLNNENTALDNKHLDQGAERLDSSSEDLSIGSAMYEDKVLLQKQRKINKMKKLALANQKLAVLAATVGNEKAVEHFQSQITELDISEPGTADKNVGILEVDTEKEKNSAIEVLSPVSVSETLTMLAATIGNNTATEYILGKGISHIKSAMQPYAIKKLTDSVKDDFWSESEEVKCSGASTSVIKLEKAISHDFDELTPDIDEKLTILLEKFRNVDVRDATLEFKEDVLQNVGKKSSGINVHKCTSVLCNLCKNGTDSVSFIPSMSSYTGSMDFKDFKYTQTNLGNEDLSVFALSDDTQNELKMNTLDKAGRPKKKKMMVSRGISVGMVENKEASWNNALEYADSNIVYSE